MSYILDTNVISELTRPRPDAQVALWLESVEESRLFLTAITLGEISRGICRLERGRRRTQLEGWLDEGLLLRFRGRILAYGHGAALTWGRLMAEGEVAGRTPPDRDCQIAAVALEHGFTIATRNTPDFESFGVRIHNPWVAM